MEMSNFMKIMQIPLKPNVHVFKNSKKKAIGLGKGKIYIHAKFTEQTQSRF